MTYINKFIIGALSVVVILVVLMCVATAQEGCKNGKKVMEYLSSKHGESVIFRGISTKGHIVLIHFNDKSGSWTASIIRPQDPTLMCGVDSGVTGELLLDNKDNSIKQFYKKNAQ